MAKKKIPGWLLGCGIGCGAIIVIGIVLVVMGGIYVGNMTEGFENAVQARERLEETHGGERDFSPRPDGGIPADRMETFLRVRDALAPVRQSIQKSFSGLPIDPDDAADFESRPFMEKLTTALGFGKAAFGLVSGAGEFFTVRNRTLLEEGMGMGEYTYIYTIAYYSWLGHSPQDGPVVSGESSGVRIEGDGIGTMSSSTSARIHRSLLEMMRNQLASVPEEEAAWRKTLEDEIAAMERERGRVAWAGGVPDSITASLEPYRDRLEESYSPTTNPFELARNTKMNRWSYRID